MEVSVTAASEETITVVVSVITADLERTTRTRVDLVLATTTMVGASAVTTGVSEETTMEDLEETTMVDLEIIPVDLVGTMEVVLGTTTVASARTIRTRVDLV